MFLIAAFTPQPDQHLLGLTKVCTLYAVRAHPPSRRHSSQRGSRQLPKRWPRKKFLRGGLLRMQTDC